MKIIFLDIDGVLNNMDSYPATIEDTLIFKLKNIIIDTNAEIVLSSDWRLDNDLKNIIETRFKLSNIPILGCTPELPTETRGKEIAAWLNAHKNWDIENFIILDDREDMDPYSSHLVQTNIREGLTWNNVTDAIAKLQEKTAYFFVEFQILDENGNNIQKRNEIFTSESAIYEFLYKNYIPIKDIQWTFNPHKGPNGENLYYGQSTVKQK